MVNTQMHAGMDWVSGTLHGFGAAAGVDIRPIGWNTDTVNLAANQHNFVVSLNGQRRVVTFDDDELEDLTADPRLQILVEGGPARVSPRRVRRNLLPSRVGIPVVTHDACPES